MKKTITLALLLIFTATTSSFGAYIWDAGGDGVSLYQEANWADDSNGGADPPANSVNGNAVVGSDLIVNFGTLGPAGPHLVLGSNSLTVTGGLVTMGSTNGIRRGSISITGGEVIAQFLADGFSGSTTLGPDVTLGGTGQLTLKGAGNPLNHGTTVNFTSFDSSLNFLAEPPAAAQTEHLSKITVNGSAAVIGSDPAVEEPGDNLVIVSDGGSGSIVTAVPEPSTIILSLLGLTCMALMTRRRRK